MDPALKSPTTCCALASAEVILVVVMETAGVLMCARLPEVTGFFKAQLAGVLRDALQQSGTRSLLELPSSETGSTRR